MKKANCLIVMLTALTWIQSSMAANVTTWVDLGVGYNDAISVDKNGNVYVSNVGNAAIGRGKTLFKVTPEGVVSNFVEIDTIGGSSVDAENNVYVNGEQDGQSVILRITPSGDQTVFSNESGGLKWNSKGELFAVSYDPGKIYTVDSAGQFTDFSTDPLLNGPVSIVFDENDEMYAANFNDGRVMHIDNSGAATLLGQVPNGIGHMTIMSGALYATGFNSRQIFNISFDGEVEVIAGSGSNGAADGNGDVASFTKPNGIAAFPDGQTLVVSEYSRTGTNLRLVSLAQNVALFANDDEVTIDEDTTTTFSPLENDDGFSSINLGSLNIVTLPTNGIASIDTENGRIDYTPNANFFGEDSLTYTVEDSIGTLSNTATVVIQVAPVADEPVATDDAITVSKNTQITSDILINDQDLDGETLSYQNVSIVDRPANGEVTVTSTGITYQPNTDYVGQDSFSYSVTNSSGLTSMTASVQVTINDTATPITIPKSSGGGIAWMLILLATCCLTRRRSMQWDN